MDPKVADELSQESSPLSDRLSMAIRNRVRASEQRWGGRHQRWRESERLYRSFRYADSEDKNTRSRSLTEGVQKIVVPYTYAQIQSILAFLVTVFTDRKPIFPVEPVGDYVKAAMLHEHLLEYQMDRMRPRGLLILIQWMFDALRYDWGVIKNVWTIREWPQLVRTFAPDLFGTGQQEDYLSEQDIVSYEGNEAMNVSPFDFFPDPHRSLADFQRGEFVAHRMRRSPTELEIKEAEGMYAGVEFIPYRPGGYGYPDVTSYAGGRSALGETVNLSQEWTRGRIDQFDKGYVNIHEMWWFCKPKELGLPTTRSNDLPSLWVFTMANAARIIRAEPANLPGRRFPFAGIQINYDVHSPATPSMVETVSGLQYHLSWLFNSRMAAVRKTLNNEVIVDPSLLETVDWSNPNPSGIWRINKEHYTTGAAKEAVFPLPVQDTTQHHLADAQTVMDLIETVTGANRLLQGLSNTGRRAATEVQAQLSLASGRMKLIGVTCAAQGMIEWAEMMLENTKMFLSQRLQVPTLDIYRKMLQDPMVNIGPELLQGEFRIPMLEQGIPTDKSMWVNTLREVLQMCMQNPSVVMPPNATINVMEVFTELLRITGIRNLQDFVTVMPDQQVQAQMQQGNLVPGAGGPSQPPPAQGSDGFPVGASPNPAASMAGAPT